MRLIMRHLFRSFVFYLTLVLALSIILVRSTSSSSAPLVFSYADITPVDLVRTTHTGSTITALAANGSGRSAETITASDGGVRFINAQPSPSARVVVGLQFGTWNGEVADIKFRWVSYGDQAFPQTTESGGSVCPASPTAIGDILEVRIEGTEVRWYINGAIACRWTPTLIDYPLKAAVVIDHSGDAAEHVQLDAGGGLTAPSAISVTATTQNSVTLGWTNNGGARIGTRISRKQLAASGLSNSNSFVLINTTGPNDTSCTDSGLSPNENYIYQLCATDGATERCMKDPSQLSGTTAFSGIINNFRRDREVYPERPPFKSLPLAGGKFYDDTFGMQIMRVTDDKEFAGDSDSPDSPDNPNNPDYKGCSTFSGQWPTFNSDKKMLLYRCGDGEGVIREFNPDTFTLGRLIRTSPLYEHDNERSPINWEGATWSKTDPDLIYCHPRYYEASSPNTTGMKLLKYHVSSGTFELDKDFAPLLSSNDSDYFFEMHISGNENLFTFGRYRTTASGGNPIEYVIWRRSDNLLLHINSHDSRLPDQGANAATPDKSGRWVYFPANGGPYPVPSPVPPNYQPEKRGAIWDLQTNTWDYVYYNGADDTPSHGDVGTGFVVGRGDFTGAVNKRLLSSVHDRTLLFDNRSRDGVRDFSNDQHMNLYANNENWITSALFDDGDDHETGTYENELMQYSVRDALSFRRLLHHRSVILKQKVSNDYWAEPKPTISLDGRYVAFTSNWNDSGRYDVFIAKMPSLKAVSDFDGDSKTDIAVWRPGNSTWYSADSSNGASRSQNWGVGTDKIVPGDYDGDGNTDYAIFRPSEGNWYIRQSSTGSNVIQNWGQDGDRPVPADYDGDGKTDLAVYRPSDGNWYVKKSGGGSSNQGWGNITDRLVPGDYDGDGRADIAVYRPSEGNWYIVKSNGGVRQENWGLSGDQPVAADYDGDGLTDLAVFRPSEGNWYIKNSTGSNTIRNWGDRTDRPVPGDYDGDGRTDFAIYRPSESNWYIILSATNTVRIRNLGNATDKPVPAAYNSE
jgi:hypothetical protein